MKQFLIILLISSAVSCTGNAQEKKKYPVSKSETDWKAELNSREFQILRNKGTEPAFSSELNNIEQAGTFVCAACEQPLYKTKHKFDSGTGWPSFDRAFDEKNVNYRPDRIGGFAATEVVCANCGGHLGHVFNDGPRATTGKRHCINGVALDFIPEK